MSQINDIRGELLQKGLATEDTLEGVSMADVGRIESLADLQLPEAYKSFLLSFGKNAGKLANDVVFFYSEILGLKEELEEMIDEEGLDFEIPSKAFIFSGYQGFQYHYFICDGKDDPEVYRIMDGGGPPEKVADTFTDYLKSMVS
ncbi:SMI1/KNR4 family protein [Pseudoteredinibacter isoporae]|uniref:SMI1/KNR4 family protein n=1 Tax=Pseudoteredinibacter isoporae TaxID=570281 RepID=UPI003105A651